MKLFKETPYIDLNASLMTNGTVMPCYRFRETIQILSLAYGNNNNIRKFECLTRLRPSEVVVSVQLINDKDDIIILAPLIFQNNHLENL